MSTAKKADRLPSGELACGECGTVVPAGTPFEGRKCYGCYFKASCPVTGCGCFPPRDEDGSTCRVCLGEGKAWDAYDAAVEEARALADGAGGGAAASLRALVAAMAYWKESVESGDEFKWFAADVDVGADWGKAAWNGMDVDPSCDIMDDCGESVSRMAANIAAVARALAEGKCFHPEAARCEEGACSFVWVEPKSDLSEDDGGDDNAGEDADGGK